MIENTSKEIGRKQEELSLLEDDIRVESLRFKVLGSIFKYKLKV